MTITLSINKDIKDRIYLKTKSDKTSLSAWTRINSNIQILDVKVDDETQQKMDNLSVLWNNLWK